MPWHSGTLTQDGPGVELAVHYHVMQDSRRRSAAILTIDSENVNVIGPACIAQRLMFAAVAAAAAAPQSDSKEDFSEEEETSSFSSQIVEQENSTENCESPTAEDVARAFLHSVDRYMEYDETVQSSQAFSARNGMSGVLYLGEFCLLFRLRQKAESKLSSRN